MLFSWDYNQLSSSHRKNGFLSFANNDPWEVKKNKEEILRDITSISNNDGETRTCAFCEMEKESTVEKHLFYQYGFVCPICFDSATGNDDYG